MTRLFWRQRNSFRIPLSTIAYWSRLCGADFYFFASIFFLSVLYFLRMKMFRLPSGALKEQRGNIFFSWNITKPSKWTFRVSSSLKNVSVSSSGSSLLPSFFRVLFSFRKAKPQSWKKPTNLLCSAAESAEHKSLGFFTPFRKQQLQPGKEISLHWMRNVRF